MSQMEQRSSSVRATDVSMEILSPTPVELTRGVEERETDSTGGVQTVDAIVVVVIPITGKLLGSSLAVGGPPFSKSACSTTISGSCILPSHSLVCGLVIACDTSLIGDLSSNLISLPSFSRVLSFFSI